MHGLLMRRADALAGCTEGSEEEAELETIIGRAGGLRDKLMADTITTAHRIEIAPTSFGARGQIYAVHFLAELCWPLAGSRRLPGAARQRHPIGEKIFFGRAETYHRL